RGRQLNSGRSPRRQTLLPFASEVGVGQAGIAHDAALRAGLEVVVAVDRHHRSPPGGGVAIDVVGTVDAGQRPATLLQDAAHLLAGDGLHGAVPEVSRAKASSWATASHPSAASRRLARTSSRVSPWVWQPGRAGMEAE